MRFQTRLSPPKQPSLSCDLSELMSDIDIEPIMKNVIDDPLSLSLARRL